MLFLVLFFHGLFPSPSAAIVLSSPPMPLASQPASFELHSDLDAWLATAASQSGIADPTSAELAKLLDADDRTGRRSDFCYPLVKVDEPG